MLTSSWALLSAPRRARADLHVYRMVSRRVPAITIEPTAPPATPPPARAMCPSDGAVRSDRDAPALRMTDRSRRGPVGSRRDHRGLTGGGQRLKDALIGVERLVGDHHIGRHRGQQVVRPHAALCPAAGQEEAHRVAQRVGQGVDLGAQSAA
jgi:hypothetical protein